jgi:hypothetical protein
MTWIPQEYRIMTMIEIRGVAQIVLICVLEIKRVRYTDRLELTACQIEDNYIHCIKKKFATILLSYLFY